MTNYRLWAGQAPDQLATAHISSTPRSSAVRLVASEHITVFLADSALEGVEVKGIFQSWLRNAWSLQGLYLPADQSDTPGSKVAAVSTSSRGPSPQARDLDGTGLEGPV